MGWVKLNLARAEGEKIEGLIIAPGIDEHTFCALVDLKGLNVKLYRLEGNTIRLEGLDADSLVVLMRRILNFPVWKDFFEAVKKGHKPDPRVSQIIEACS
jgi:hypothetical protein